MELVDDTAPQGLDLPRLIAAVSARKRWILLPTLAAFSLALVFVLVVKPRYTATAKVMLENGESYFTRPEKAQADGAGAVIDDLTVESEAEAAKSPDVERKALAMLRPEDRQEFEGSGGLFSLLGSRVYDDPRDKALEAFAANVNIYPQNKTRVLLFEFTSSDRGAAARGADALASAFLGSQRDVKDDEAKSASQWLSDQINTLRAKVATSESRIEALRAKSGLLAGPNGLAVPSQQLSEISAQIATARAAESAAKTKASALISLVRSGRLDDVVSVANDESIRRYAESRVAIKSQISELGRTMLPGHPRMKELAGQLAGLEQEIRTAALKRVRGYEEDARIAESQVKSLEAATADQARAVTSSDDDQVKLRELEIDAKTARDQLESYLTKYREAIARDAENAAPANGRIIATALTPSAPSFPKTGPTLLLAPLAAFLVSLGLVVARILLGDAPARRALVERPAVREPRLPFGIDPPVAPSEPAPDDSARHKAAWTATVESFVDKLADASEGERLALMVAAEGGAGALPVALAAARLLARRGAAALVDLGPSPAWLPDMFDRGLDRGPVTAGLADLIAGAADFTQAAHRDISTPLHIIPSGQGEVDADGLVEILEALMAHYDFVLVHAPDWREKPALVALGDMAALLIAAPSAEIAEVTARVRAALRDDQLAIKPIAVGPRPAQRERAA